MARIADWLEAHWLAPAYSGWILAGISICFFGAAINSMAGWLYVLSSISLALLGIAAVIPARSLLGLQIRRYPIAPVSVGEPLKIELEIQNQTKQPKTLFQVQDMLPFVLSQPVQTSIEIVSPEKSYHWVYNCPTLNRGIYHWHTVQLRTATPLGLFWCRRSREVPAKAIVYPTVLPLANCPLLDQMGQENNTHYSQEHRLQAATEGLTRSLRPYRIGDPTRLIHWRTSARYGELRVRELETITGGEEIVICLDTASTWQPDNFEQAVIAAASLYFYAHRQQLSVKLWTATTGLVQGDRLVLETLAATQPAQGISDNKPNYPLLWLSQNPLSINTLSPGSRWILWHVSSFQPDMLVNQNLLGIALHNDQPLQLQLQQLLS